jgi:hypothetical protein
LAGACDRTTTSETPRHDAPLPADDPPVPTGNGTLLLTAAAPAVAKFGDDELGDDELGDDELGDNGVMATGTALGAGRPLRPTAKPPTAAATTQTTPNTTTASGARRSWAIRALPRARSVGRAAASPASSGSDDGSGIGRPSTPSSKNSTSSSPPVTTSSLRESGPAQPPLRSLQSHPRPNSRVQARTRRPSRRWVPLCLSRCSTGTTSAWRTAGSAPILVVT